MNKYYGLKHLIGKTIREVLINHSKDMIVFKCNDSDIIAFEAHGDCCSSSWIENITNAQDLTDGLVLEVKELDLSDRNNNGGEYGEYVQFYGEEILALTPNGPVKCLIEYRNESNGYYGGDLILYEGKIDLSDFKQIESDI